MTDPNATTYRGYGDVEGMVIARLLGKASSPMLATASATTRAASPHSALFWAQAWLENQWETTGRIIRPEDHNPVSLRPWAEDPTATRTVDIIDWQTRRKVGTMRVPPYASGVIRSGDGALMLRFPDDASGAREWRRRLFDDPTYKGGIYRGATTLTQMLAIYAPPGDVHPVTGLDNKHINYAEVVLAQLRIFAALEAPVTVPEKDNPPVADTAPATAAVIRFGNVPKFGMIDRQFTTANKPEGAGWDNLGKRTPKFVVLHRMIGSLLGTDSFFPTAPALTDYGIGIAARDGAALSKIIYQWNDPYGYRSGWASGPVNGAYGDGAAIVATMGINAVNRDGVSIEISGNYDTPIASDEFEEIAAFLAYWWDQMKIRWDQAPINPATGISAVMFHQEFTLGTGKICPGPVVMNSINDLIARAKAIMKRYQTAVGGTTAPLPTPPPVVVPPPAPMWVDPKPVLELAMYTKADADSAPEGIKTSIGLAIWVNDDIEAIRDTYRKQEPKADARFVGPTLKAGQIAHALWLIILPNGERWYYSDYYTFFLAADFKRIKD